MNKKYESPVIEIEKFTFASQIMTTSLTEPDPEIPGGEIDPDF